MTTERRYDQPWWMEIDPREMWRRSPMAQWQPEAPTAQRAVSATPQWLTPRTQEIMQRPEAQQRLADIEAGRALDIFAPPPAPAPTMAEPPAWIGEYAPPPFPTEKPPEGYDWKWDSSSMRYVLSKRPGAAPISEYQRKQIELAEQEAERAQELSRWQEEQLRLEEQERTRAQEQQVWQRGWQEQQAAQEAEQWQQQQQMQQQQFQQQMGWYQEQAQMQQAEAERQEMARLSAQPMSWLQYAAYTGEQPAIQPWMQPLMAQQYPSLQTGQAIPGFTPESMTGMPQLTTPSAQLWGRMGPTAQAGFAGYQQAQQGIRPEETQFRMQAGAPPGGRSPGLRWTR